MNDLNSILETNAIGFVVPVDIWRTPTRTKIIGHTMRDVRNQDHAFIKITNEEYINPIQTFMERVFNE